MEKTINDNDIAIYYSKAMKKYYTNESVCCRMCEKKINDILLITIEFSKKYHTDLKRDNVNNFIKTVNSKDWVVYPDLDEFINLKQSFSGKFKTLRELGEELEKNDNNMIYGFMCDRITDNNTLPKIKTGESMETQFPFYSKLSMQLGIPNFNSRKYIFFKPPFKLISSHTHEENKTISSNIKQFLVIDHYKWDKSVVSRLKPRLQLYKNCSGSDRYKIIKNLVNNLSKGVIPDNVKKYKNFDYELIPQRFRKDLL